MSPQQGNPLDDGGNNAVSSFASASTLTAALSPSATGDINNVPVNSGDSPGSSSSTTTQTRISIPAFAPAGAIIVTEPPPSISTMLYKIAPSGNPLNASANLITFGWNLTSVLVQPTQLTVQAVCDNGFTYPVASATQGTANDSSDDSSFPDGVIPASQSQVVWDIVGYQADHPETPIPQGLCTLRIADERGFAAARRAGYLSPNIGAATFAFYTGEAYVPIANGWECLSCNSNSISSTYDANPVMLSLLVTLVVCVLSGAQILFKANFGTPATARAGASVPY